MSLFLSEPGQIGFYSVIALLLASVIVGANRRRSAPPLRVKPVRSSSALNGIAGIFVMVGTPLLGYAGIEVLPDWTYFLGLLLFVFGIGMYVWCQQTLGRYFSTEGVIYQGHQLVAGGPYKFVRHPIYTSLFIGVVGVGLMAQSWVASVLVAVTTGIAYGYRIRVEERLLASEFGEQYESYSRRVKRFIPFII